MVDPAEQDHPLGPVLGDEFGEIQFGKYQLVRKIAVGGMAEVYLAKSFGQFGFEKPVVVKVLLPKLSANEEFREMFVREALMAADFRHPRLCQVYDVGEVNGLYYIAMEFVDGVDLTRIVRRARTVKEPLSRALAIRIVLDLLEGLKYVHTAKAADGSPLHIVHRDVTPQNIMVAFDGQVKLVDFGVAKTSIAEELRQASLKGKGPYMAPEQWRGTDIDGRADLFALGIVLYELTVGKRLFKRGNPGLVRKAIVSGEVVAPGDIRSDYPLALENVVLRALQVDPNQRFQDAADFSEALSAVARQEQLRVSTEELATYVSRLFEGVSRDDVFRPLELTAPGHAVEAAAAANRSPSEDSLPVAEDPDKRAVPPWAWLVAAGVALLALGFLLGHLTGRATSTEGTSRADPASAASLLPVPAARGLTPKALRGCEVTFPEVSITAKGRVSRIGPDVHLTCGGQAIPAGDPRLDSARRALHTWHFRPWRVRGRPVGTTTPITVSF